MFATNENLGIDRSFMRSGGVSQFCSNYCLQSSMLPVGLSDPAPTSAPSQKSGFEIFLDRMKPNPTAGQGSGWCFFFFFYPVRSVFFPSPTPYLLLFLPSFFPCFFQLIIFSSFGPLHSSFFFFFFIFFIFFIFFCFVWLCLRSV